MNINFNAFDYDPSQGGSICFPLADYQVEITGVEPKVVKDNPGAGYLEITFTVIAGDLRGMTHAHRLNLFNPSEVAKRIANQELAAIAFAINRPYLQTSEQLIGGRLIATIGPQAEPNEKYSHVIKIKNLDGTLPTKPAQSPQAVQTQAPAPAAAPVPAQAASAAPPWATAPAAAPAAASAPPWASSSPSPSQGATVAPPWATGAPAQAAAPTSAPPWAK
jgi:hypothetical protein